MRDRVECYFTMHSHQIIMPYQNSDTYALPRSRRPPFSLHRDVSNLSTSKALLMRQLVVRADDSQAESRQEEEGCRVSKEAGEASSKDIEKWRR